MATLFWLALPGYAQAVLPVEEPGVCFYEHSKFDGKESCYRGTDLEVGSLEKGINDTWSSVRLTGGIAVIAHEHGNFGGHFIEIYEDSSRFDKLNDKISSFKIVQKPEHFFCLYMDLAFTGSPVCYSAGEERSSLRGQADNINDNIDAVSIHGNVELDLWEHDSYAGQKETLTRSNGNIVLRNKASSFKSRIKKTQDPEYIDKMMLQNQVAMHARLYEGTWLGTHNSFNAGEYYWSSAKDNQIRTMTQQLNMGVRHIELDLVDYQIKHRVDTSGTDPERIITELKNWLVNHPGEPLFIKLEVHSSASDQKKFRTLLKNSFGSWLYTSSAATCEAPPATTTVKDLLGHGIRIYMYNNANNCQDISDVLHPNTGSEWSESHDYNSSCVSEAPDFGRGAFSMAIEDRRYAPGTSSYKHVPFNRILSALQCGMNYVSRDKIYMEEKDFFDGYTYLGQPDTLLVSPRENDRAALHLHKSDGRAHLSRWSPDNDSARHAVCKDKVGQMFVTKALTTWTQADSACKKDGGMDAFFGIPNNAKDVQTLTQAFPNDTLVWINIYESNGDWTVGYQPPLEPSNTTRVAIRDCQARQR